MLRIETALIALSVIIAFACPSLTLQGAEAVERRFASLIRNRAVAVLLVGFLAASVRIAVLPVEPIPEPIVHDEFGYLLAADTFAHGHVTNPTPPMWAHFESFSIIVKPTYQCFAQPAQGLFLAVGQRLLGHPFWGVVISVAAMCALITWMLQPWVGEGWAVIGGLLAILRFGAFSYWANSYWGGAVGAIGGALILGALPRIRLRQRPRDALFMALGLAILANSRPYEGFVFSIPVAAALAVWLFSRHAPPWLVSVKNVILPILAVLAVVGLGMGYYFWRVTGSPFRMPYQVERETYAVAPYLLWQHPRPMPVYRHAEFARMYADKDVENFRFARSARGIALFAILKIFRIWVFFIGPALSLPIAMMAFALPYGFGWKQIDPKVRFLILTLGVFLIGLFAESYFEPHYAAPITCLLLALVLMAMQRLERWTTRGRRTGAALNRAIIVVCLLSFIARTVAAARGWELSRSQSPAWHQVGPKSFGRAALLTKLQALPGKQLVIVQYSPDHDLFDEWVYNDPDIEQAKVVWARDMGQQENAKLVNCFKDRQVWTLEADDRPPKIVPWGLSKN